MSRWRITFEPLHVECDEDDLDDEVAALQPGYDAEQVCETAGHEDRSTVPEHDYCMACLIEDAKEREADRIRDERDERDAARYEQADYDTYEERQLDADLQAGEYD